MKNKYIKFIEGDEEDLELACKLAEKNGYNQMESISALTMEGTGILKCSDSGDYLTSCNYESDMISNGYVEIKRSTTYKKLDVGTKIKVIACKTGHCLDIGKTYIIRSIGNYSNMSGFSYKVKDDPIGWNVSSNEIEVVESTIEFKIGNLVTIGDNKTIYKIEKIEGNMIKLVHLKTRNRYEYHIEKLKLYTGTDTVEVTDNILFKIGNTVKVIDVGKLCSFYDTAAKAMGLTKWEISISMYSSKQIKDIINYNYYKVIGIHTNDNGCIYIGIESMIYGKQYIIKQEGIEHMVCSIGITGLQGDSNLKDQLYNDMSQAFAYALDSTLTGTNTGCIDYPISYLDTSTCTVNKLGTITNTLLTNNNTMEKLNQLRADKFFANEKNLIAIETLDTLLKDAIELVVATKGELDRVQTKLIGLNRKLETATNNQDVALLKDLISSTKVVESFVKELEDKTISKFETAKTSFDVVGYLKD